MRPEKRALRGQLLEVHLLLVEVSEHICELGAEVDWGESVHVLLFQQGLNVNLLFHQLEIVDGLLVGLVLSLLGYEVADVIVEYVVVLSVN